MRRFGTIKKVGTRLGAVGLGFFLLKGICWLGLGALAMEGCK